MNMRLGDIDLQACVIRLAAREIVCGGCCGCCGVLEGEGLVDSKEICSRDVWEREKKPVGTPRYQPPTSRVECMKGLITFSVALKQQGNRRDVHLVHAPQPRKRTGRDRVNPQYLLMCVSWIKKELTAAFFGFLLCG